MFDFQRPNFEHTKWDEKENTFDGNAGWYSDSLKEGWRVIYAEGTWHDKSPFEKGNEDYLTDANIKPSSVIFDKQMKGHSGFLNYGDRTFVCLQKANVFFTDRKLMFIGHSLGAGAIIYAALLYNYYTDSQKKIAIRVFGLPRPFGNNALCKYVEKFDFKAFSIGNEFVDKLYILSFLMGYRRPLPLIKKQNKINYTGTIGNKINQYFQSLNEDHQPQLYVKMITNEEVLEVKNDN